MIWRTRPFGDIAARLPHARLEQYYRVMLSVRHRSISCIVVVAGITLASCGSPAPTGGNASAIKACDLLTVEEIKQATGATMVAGKLQTTDTQSSCDWSSGDDNSGASGVGVIVQNFDATLWQTMSASQHAIPVTGIGEQAFKGVPHKGDLAVKKGNYEVDVGIVDFKHDDATVDAASLKLMNLVLSRL